MPFIQNHSPKIKALEMKQFFWIFLFLTALFTTGCYDIYGRKLKVEFDQVRGNTTITKELYLTKIAENRTGFGRVQQTLQKTITQTGETEYWVYEQLILSTLMHPLESVIYLLIDDTIFPIEVGGQETEAFSKISEETKALSTSDSTTVTVVTGYSLLRLCRPHVFRSRLCFLRICRGK